MSAYATSSTVQAQGEVRIAGVPFAPGTEVEVTISPKLPTAQEISADERVACLLAALDKGHNVQSLGRLNREALYDRNILR